MRIDVTAEDIANGVPRSCDSCPVALAISRVAGKGVINVGTTSFRFYTDHYPLTIGGSFPEKVSKFILRFDGHKKVQPFSFELEMHVD